MLLKKDAIVAHEHAVAIHEARVALHKHVIV